MEKELRKFLVILRPDSAAATIFGSDPDTTISEMPALTCSEMDLSGAHARIKRIPTEKSQAAKRGSLEQVWWIASADIAAAFEYTGSEATAGFGS